MGQDMEITESQFGDAVLLVPVGRVDQSTAPAFQSAMLDVVGKRGAVVVIDFSGIPYISSVGLRALMIAAKQGKAAKVPLAVVGLTPDVNEVFEISRFNFVVDIYDTVEAALTALSSDAAAAYAAK